MKKITFLFIAVFCGITLVNAQKAQTISDPNTVATITIEQIEALGQHNNDGDRGLTYLDFEGLGDNDDINDFYNGGTSQQGFSGSNYEFQFVGLTALIDSDAGGSGSFANEPSPSTVMFFPDGNQGFINVAAGFTTSLSFYYSTNYSDGFVSVYDGLNGTGSLLGTISLPANYQNGGCTGDPNGAFCNWDLINVPFTGTAKSVVFGGTSGQIAFDDVTINIVMPVPISAWAIFLGIFLIGLFVIYGFRRRLA